MELFTTYDPRFNVLHRDALALSSGTISYLIHCTRYAVIDAVRREFAFYCLKHPNYKTWVDAWKAFETAGNPDPIFKQQEKITC